MNPYDLPVDRRRPPEPDSAGPKPPPGHRPLPPETGRLGILAAGPVTATAERALAWYIDNDGLAELPRGSNYVPGVTDRWGLNGQPWCAMAASIALMAAGFGSLDDFVLDLPGVATDYGCGWAFCPSIVRDFRNAGRWYDSGPLPGDVVLFDWEGDGEADHVGMVEQDLGDGTVLTREGNADDRVGQHRRSVQDILGYGRPPYAATKEDDMFTDDDRSRLETVEAKVADLRAYMEDEKGGAQDTIAEAVAGVVNQINAKLDKLKVGGGAVDVDALAERVADKLAERLKA